jgi:hypothetical protein
MINYNTIIQKDIFRKATERWAHPKFSPIDLLATARIDLGTYMVNSEVGLQFNFLNTNANFLMDYLANMPTLTEKSGLARIRFNMFVHPILRYTPYNTTLEGAMINDHSVYTIDHSNVKRGIFDLELGANIVLSDVVSIKYKMMGRTQEFENGKQFHWWGAFTLGISAQKWYK